MATYWYASVNKLTALGALSPGALSRLRTTLKVGLGGTGVEVGLDPAASRTIDKAVATAERQLDHRGDIRDVADFIAGPPPAVYFRCQGPASRGIRQAHPSGSADTFWVAAVDGSVAVLLVGSASNAIGAKADIRSVWASATADPIGAVQTLLEEAEQDATLAEALRPDLRSGYGWEPDVAEAWGVVLARDISVARGDIDALPRVASVAQYVTRTPVDRPPGLWPGIDWLILGTPIYVAQVAQRPGDKR